MMKTEARSSGTGKAWGRSDLKSAAAPHFCACCKPGLRCHISWLFLRSNIQDSFVDIGGIVYHHSLNSLFTINSKKLNTIDLLPLINDERQHLHDQWMFSVKVH